MKKSSLLFAIIALLVIISGILICYQYVFTRHGRLMPPQRVVVCIDPGHPSETNSGRIMQHGTCELNMNWDVAQRLRKILEQDKRIRVVLTRTKRDTFTRNRERALIANAKHASLAIHLHCDAGPSHGFTVYYPDKKGKSEGKRGPSKKVIAQSQKAAIAVHQGLVDMVQRRDRGLKGESKTRVGRAIGGLTVSIWSKVPSVTVEMIFLSNKSDAEYIKSSAGQDQMAHGLARGIELYLKPELTTFDKKYTRWQASMH